MLMAVAVASAWMLVIVDLGAWSLLCSLLLALACTFAILIGAMGLGLLGFGLFGIAERVLEWLRQTARWPTE
jgi:hypothetical protein